jgi:sterol 3beta-glucosyltransferase
MRITVATLGSRGDVQPMVVLARELAARGHEVTMGVPPNLVPFVNRAGFPGHPIGPDSQAFVESPDGQRWLASGDARAFFRAMGKVAHDMASQGDTELLRACRGAELIISGVLGEDHAVCVAEAAAIPVVCVHLAPVRATRAYPQFLLTTRPLPPMLNRATAMLVEQVVWRTLRGDTRALRTRLGLRPQDHPTARVRAARGMVELQAYSPLLVPDLVDYGSQRPLIGFLTPDAALRADLGEAEPDPGLEAWLAAGDPPVYFGFGSMPVLDPVALTAVITGVARRLGVRALISAGWSALGSGQAPDPAVRVVGPVDHARILPRCSLAVHHGGAGTTAAAVAAGLPTLVCSVFADQPFWGARLVRLGVGAHCRFVDLDASTLEAGLRQLLTPGTAQRAGALGAALSAERGAARRAADAVERVAVTAQGPAGASGVGPAVPASGGECCR